MDIVERLQKLVGVYIGDADIDDELLDAKAEIERLRDAAKDRPKDRPKRATLKEGE
jgi:hypothetical protein